ncbi:Cullin-5 [Xenotaenia resolanae]|uniref:Cullin-5 n=1 Tax=Xenotaenia resolanae TaxID=208358 RepID=A0ABV0W317_9TELE
MAAPSNLLKNKGSLQFEDKWDLMRPIVLKLLRQESVTKQQWFDLFSDVHAVCLWDDKGPAKIHQALKEDILDFIKQAQAVRKPVCLFYGRTNTD